jgi:hypothetical protein
MNEGQIRIMWSVRTLTLATYARISIWYQNRFLAF